MSMLERFPLLVALSNHSLFEKNLANPTETHYYSYADSFDTPKRNNCLKSLRYFILFFKLKQAASLHVKSIPTRGGK